MAVGEERGRFKREYGLHRNWIRGVPRILSFPQQQHSQLWRGLAVDGARLVVATYTGKVQERDLETMEVAAEFEVGMAVACMVVNFALAEVVVGTYQKLVRLSLYLLAAGTCGYCGLGVTEAFSIVVCRVTKVIDLPTGTITRTMTGHFGPVLRVATNERYIATGGTDHLILVYERQGNSADAVAGHSTKVRRFLCKQMSLRWCQVGDGCVVGCRSQC